MSRREKSLPVGGVLLEAESAPVVAREAGELCAREVAGELDELFFGGRLGDRYEDLDLGERQLAARERLFDEREVLELRRRSGAGRPKTGSVPASR